MNIKDAPYIYSFRLITFFDIFRNLEDIHGN